MKLKQLLNKSLKLPFAPVATIIVKEEIIKNDDISDVRGKIVKSVEVNDITVIVHFDDDSKLQVSSQHPDNKIEYHYHKGMMKSQGTDTMGGTNRSAVNI